MLFVLQVPEKNVSETFHLLTQAPALNILVPWTGRSILSLTISPMSLPILNFSTSDDEEWEHFTLIEKD